MIRIWSRQGPFTKSQSPGKGPRFGFYPRQTMEAPATLGRPIDVEQQLPSSIEAQPCPERPEVMQQTPVDAKLPPGLRLDFVKKAYGIMILMQLLTLGTSLAFGFALPREVLDARILFAVVAVLAAQLFVEFSAGFPRMCCPDNKLSKWYDGMMTTSPWDFLFLTTLSVGLGVVVGFFHNWTESVPSCMLLLVVLVQPSLSISFFFHAALNKVPVGRFAYGIAVVEPVLVILAAIVSAGPRLSWTWWSLLIAISIASLLGTVWVSETQDLFCSVLGDGKRREVQYFLHMYPYFAWNQQTTIFYLFFYLPLLLLVVGIVLSLGCFCCLLCSPCLAVYGLYSLGAAPEAVADPMPAKHHAAYHHACLGTWVMDLPCGRQATATVASRRFDCADQGCELKKGPPTHFEWPGGVCQELMSVDHNGSVLLWRTRSRWPQTLRWTRVPSCPSAEDGHTMQALSSPEAYVCAQCGKEHSAATPSVRWHSHSHGASLCPDCHPCPKQAVLGVSAEWILGTFPELARSSTGKANPNFHEICPAVAMGPQGLGFGKTCPRDGGLGCSILDALDDSYRGRATHFVSWCWDYTLEDFVSAIQSWIQKEASSPSDVCLWVCFFCNNQFLGQGKEASCSLCVL